MKKTTLFTVALVIFTLSGRAQWHWVNPLPQGNALTDIFFPDLNTGYIVGYYGTIFKTTDGGNNWNLINSGTTANLEAVFFTSADTGYVCGSGTVIRKTTDGGLTWTPQNSNPVWGSDIFFTSANVGYACGGTSIIKTTNGGATWNLISTLPGSGAGKIFFTTPSAGYATGTNGIVYKTIDGGSTWSTLNTGTSDYLRALCFTDTSNGYFVGENGTIRRTTNAGNSWIATNSNTGERLTSVSFPDPQTGYIGGIHSALLKTIDGGTTWTPLNTLPWVAGSDMLFINATTGFAVGAGLIVMTTDGGLTWTPKTFGVTFNPLVSTQFPDAQTGFAAGIFGDVLKTTDGGATWSALSSNLLTYGGYNAVYFTDINNGYVAGSTNGDSIYKTTDGGLSWTSMPPPITSNYSVEVSSMFFFSPDTGFINTNFVPPLISNILKTNNGAASWSGSFGASRVIKKIFFSDQNHGFAVGDDMNDNGIFIKTTDGGNTWVQSYTNTNTLYGTWFLDSLNGYAVGYSSGTGIILKTTDGGNNWAIYNTHPGRVLSVCFADMNRGYAVGTSGDIFKTVDAGNTWTLQASGTTNFLYDIYLTHGDTGIVVGASGTILTNDSTLILTSAWANDFPKQNVMNYPNPFSNYSTISYELSRGGNVSVEILDVSGKMIKKIFEGIQSEGEHKVLFSSDNMLPGVYFYLIKTKYGVQSGKMVKLND